MSIARRVQTGNRSRGRPATKTLRADLRRERVIGRPPNWRRDLQSLSWAFDDLTADLGDDLYERMLVDPQVLASVNITKADVLGDGMQLSNNVEDVDHPSFGEAKRILEFCERVVNEYLQTPLHDWLWAMLDALAFGARVAELVYEVWEGGPDDGRLVLRRLKIKARRAVRLVIDPFGNVVGLLAATPEAPSNPKQGAVGEGELQALLPADKFAILTFRPRDDDPRGSSLLRAAYNAWWMKMQAMPEFLKYLAQFGTPSLAGFTSEDAFIEAEQDEAGNLVDPTAEATTPEDDLLALLQQFQNGTGIALPHGYDLKVIESAREGQVFFDAFALFNREIAEAITHQTLATQQSQNQARAAAEVHQDVLTAMARSIKPMVAALVRDVLRRMVGYNFGRDAELLTPKVSLGLVQQQDLTREMGAVATLFGSGYFTQAQMPAVDRRLGFPARTALPVEEGGDAPAKPPARPAGTQDAGPGADQGQQAGG